MRNPFIERSIEQEMRKLDISVMYIKKMDTSVMYKFFVMLHSYVLEYVISSPVLFLFF